MPEITAPPKHRIWRMFDLIAGRYDLLNHLLSGGQDILWRRSLTRHLPTRDGQRLLDLATGTADQLLILCRTPSRMRLGVGVDRSEGMLALGRSKVRAAQLGHVLTLLPGDATQLPFADDSFDAVTMSFGIRNVTDVAGVLGEAWRVLRPGGRALILELSMPRGRLARALYLFYFRHILPIIGGWISGNAPAYRYLIRSVEAFPSGQEFANYLIRAGFRDVQALPLTLGIATLYRGDKPSSQGG